MEKSNSLNQAITTIFGENIGIKSRRPVFGGDINNAYALTLSDGTEIFMKANTRQKLGILEGEAESLGWIRKTGTIRSPEVFAIGTDGNISFLLLEFIRSGKPDSSSFEEFGISLAKMHAADPSDFVKGGKFGALHDHLLGSGMQANTPMDSWPEFFAECRLRPQFEKASSWFDAGGRKRFESFLADIGNYLPEPEKPSLLHGDLWGGNYMIDSSGHPWLIDPAAYVGHAEADIAMTELFGGFSHTFYSSYWSAAGFDPGYGDRRDLYNLYHLLKHLNLFGGSYLYSVMAVIKKYCG